MIARRRFHAKLSFQRKCFAKKNITFTSSVDGLLNRLNSEVPLLPTTRAEQNIISEEEHISRMTSIQSSNRLSHQQFYA
jgi:hypothetical protein